MERIETARIAFELDEATLAFTVRAGEKVWKSQPDFVPTLKIHDEEIKFTDAGEISHRRYTNGLGAGIRSTFTFDRVQFETDIWLENGTDHLYFEWIPLREEQGQITRVDWPAPMAFEQLREDAYTLIPYLQGLMIPNTWENDVNPLYFNSQFCSSAAYMPWFSQVEEGQGYLAIALTEWDGGYQIVHSQAGPTHIHTYWLPSLGKMAYKRVLRMSFLEDCDHNTVCKAYRQYAIETGRFVTLAQKELRVPNVARLVGSCVLHKGIKKHTKETSAYYNKEHPEENDWVTTFARRGEELRAYKDLGVEKLYLHLDGWGDPGYDNQHPDIFPPCIQAGGWEGLRNLSRTAEECGYVFGIHDQYRDYYFDAETFDERYACRDTEGKIFDKAIWAGGRQSLLCASLAPGYVKRNFTRLLENGVHLDATYLDVFTCNEPDECNDPAHTMTRRECLGYRNACFDYLSSLGIAPSSEEVNDWAIRSLAFCHYAPYSFMLAKPDAPAKGIPVPLFNLVYHECVVIPWLMDRREEQDYMLYALLNGGIAYLDCDTFTSAQMDEERIRRCQEVGKLHERVAHSEMVRHEFLNPERTVQRTTFRDGTVVTVDLAKGSYTIA